MNKTPTLTLPMMVSAFGLFLVLPVALPLLVLSFVVAHGFWLFAIGLVIGAVGILLGILGVMLKCASILFRK